MTPITVNMTSLTGAVNSFIGYFFMPMNNSRLEVAQGVSLKFGIVSKIVFTLNRKCKTNVLDKGHNEI